MIEAPEFHTETLSPLSPFPLHPPESSKIPVLQNQIDPIFNMTSTHTEEPHESTTSSEDTGVDLLAAVSAGIEDEGSPSDSSSFSDAYKDQADAVEEIKPAEVVTRIDDDADSDDYAMTFDSDGEDGSGSQVISQANVEQDPNPLPASVPSSNPVSLLTSESLAIDTNIAQTTSLPNYPSTDEHPSETPTQTQIETAQPTHTYEDIASGEVDIQALLDNITANAEKNEATSALSTPTSANPSSASLPQGLSSLPAHSSLPPRPQVPLPTYPFLDEASKNRTGPPNYSKPSNTYRPPPGLNIPLIPSGAAPGTSTDTRGVLFAPPVASFRQNAPYSAGTPISPAAPFTNAPGIPNHDRQTQSMDFSEDYPDSDTRWSSDVQKKYDNFLTEERNYVTDGQWDKFPNGSRLFIGNLPSEKVTKRDIFHIFHKYGRLAQIAIKSAYGFVQFHDSSACRAALVNEEGSEIRGRKIHLEISKAQKNTNNRNAQNNNAVRRSRSPDYGRGHNADRGNRGGGHNRQDSRSEVRDEYGRVLRNGRDDYRPGRSPSPPRGGYRGHDGYGAPRGDLYDGRERWRSRSRSPYGQRFSGGYRERSPSPRRREAIADAELELPRREPHNVPDVQIILTTQLDRNFISWVEGEFHTRGLKSEVLFLSPRLPLADVIHRQILEGVHAVSLLDVRTQTSSTIPLQVFDRQAGANNVRFDEYQDLEPRIAAELVLRTKTQAASAYPPSQPQYAPQQSYQLPSAPAQQVQPQALANIVGQMDNASLQALLGSMTTSQQQNGPAAASNANIDLASLLNGLKPQQSQQVQYQAPTPTNAYSGVDYAALLGNQPQQAAPQQSAQQVQNIMAQLARFRQ